MRQSQAFGCLDLAAVDGLDARAQDFAGVGADIDHQRQAKGEDEAAEEALTKQGLVVDTLQIQEIRDGAYIEMDELLGRR